MDTSPPRQATSYDVATLAGVSQSTVSRCFRDGASLSPDKRERIEAAAQALGYAPNKIARSLITQRSNIIGVLVGEATVHAYPDLLLKLGAEIQAAGRRMLVFTLSGPDTAAAALPDILAYHVDGLIAGFAPPGQMLDVCAQRRIPIVLYNNISDDGWSCSVGCDDTAALAALVAHLHANGSRRLDVIAGPGSGAVSRSRLQALREAAATYDLPIARTVHAAYSYEAGRIATRALAPLADTLVCANDAIALGAIDACRYDLGLSIPLDIAIAGYDNIPEGAWPPYSLTTLAQPLEMLTRTAVRMIVEQLEGAGASGEHRLMPASLVVRGSTRLG